MLYKAASILTNNSLSCMFTLKTIGGARFGKAVTITNKKLIKAGKDYLKIHLDRNVNHVKNH